MVDLMILILPILHAAPSWMNPEEHLQVEVLESHIELVTAAHSVEAVHVAPSPVTN